MMFQVRHYFVECGTTILGCKMLKSTERRSWLKAELMQLFRFIPPPPPPGGGCLYTSPRG